MVRFLAIKTNYDNRQSLPPHLKYSRLPTFKEYNRYLKRFHEENIGGNGFHECLNFAIPENGNSNVNFYIPPTCLPKSDSSEDELVIFKLLIFPFGWKSNSTILTPPIRSFSASLG